MHGLTCLIFGGIFFFGGIFGLFMGDYAGLKERIITSIFGVVVGLPIMVVGLIWTIGEFLLNIAS